MDPVVGELRALRRLIGTIVILAALVLLFVFVALPAIKQSRHDLDCQRADAQGVYRNGCN